MGTLCTSIDDTCFPTEELQTYVYDQLQSLKADILKYDEVKSEYHKICQSKDHLHKQLEKERANSEDLKAQLGGLLDIESNLRSRCSHLELELNTLTDRVHDRESEPSEFELQVSDLLKQLRTVENDFEDVKLRLAEAEQIRQDQDNEVAKWKVSFLLILHRL